MLKFPRCGLAFAMAAMIAGQSLADQQVDLQIKARKMIAYAQAVYAQYPAQKAYILHNKTPDGQGLADQIYEAIRKSGKDAIAYEGFTQGDPAGDYRFIETADVLFCGCTSSEAKAVKDAAVKQGFTGQFVHLSLPK
jgi:ABC-type branched-subunit amino acid transport system substrate-binding protein